MSLHEDYVNSWHELIKSLSPSLSISICLLQTSQVHHVLIRLEFDLTFLLQFLRILLWVSISLGPERQEESHEETMISRLWISRIFVGGSRPMDRASRVVLYTKLGHYKPVLSLSCSMDASPIQSGFRKIYGRWLVRMEDRSCDCPRSFRDFVLTIGCWKSNWSMYKNPISAKWYVLARLFSRWGGVSQMRQGLAKDAWRPRPYFCLRLEGLDTPDSAFLSGLLYWPS